MVVLWFGVVRQEGPVLSNCTSTGVANKEYWVVLKTLMQSQQNIKGYYMQIFGEVQTY